MLMHGLSIHQKYRLGMMAHVEAWEIIFKVGENENASRVEFNAGRIYPGMDPVEEKITAYNLGEKQAVLSYTIEEIMILGEVYVVEAGKVTFEVDDDEEDPLYGLGPVTMTVEQFLDRYPFKITIGVSNNGEMEPETGISVVTFKVEWEWESGDDELDTKWGKKAYDYYLSLEPEGDDDETLISSIVLKIELRATQVNE